LQVLPICHTGFPELRLCIVVSQAKAFDSLRSFLRKFLMKTSFAAATAVLIATTVAGFAADLPVKAAPYFAPPPVFSWTGFYVGGNAGYGWGNANDSTALGGAWLVDGTRDNLILSPLGNGQLHPNGFTGGIQAGYNFQAGQWVTGIEADANYFGLKGQFSRTVTNAFSGSPYTFASSFESDWLVTVRPRIGYAFGHLLVYATGGLAVANQRPSQNITQLNLVFTEAGSVSKTTVGWTAGAGVEYAFDNRWSVKAEYLYVDPGSVSFSTSGDTDSTYTGSHSAHLKVNIVRAGLNYHFN
jgi:outer membrane immunogenic protein